MSVGGDGCVQIHHRLCVCICEGKDKILGVGVQGDGVVVTD